MRRTLSVSEARAMLPALVERVERGEEITLTRHGRPVAVVIRPDALRTRKGGDAMASAAEIHTQLEAARRLARPAKGVSRKRAEALLADVRSARTRK